MRLPRTLSAVAKRERDLGMSLPFGQELSECCLFNSRHTNWKANKYERGGRRGENLSAVQLADAIPSRFHVNGRRRGEQLRVGGCTDGALPRKNQRTWRREYLPQGDK